MPSVRLTDAFLRKVERPENGVIRYWDTDLRGFVADVQKNVTTLYYDRNNRRHLIGRFPTVTMPQARETARELDSQLRRGYAGVNTLRQGRLEDLAMHPTVKPVALVADAIKDCTGRGHIVLDAFAGSGTTIMAAHKTGRRGCALELDPRYVDVAIQRWERLTDEPAIHAESGLAFDEVGLARDPATDPSAAKLNRRETGRDA